MKIKQIFESLNEIVEKYKEDEDVYAIILRGSLSRGDYDIYSDIDLTIIVNEKFKDIKQGVGKTKTGVHYGLRFIVKDTFYNQEWSLSMRHAYQFSKILYSKLDDLDDLIMKKCLWKEHERLKCLSKNVVNAQFCFPFFNIRRKVIQSEYIKAKKRGFKKLSLIQLMEAIENLCDILCILNGIFPPEKKLFWTHWFENNIDFTPKGFSLVKLDNREELIEEFNKDPSSEKLLRILKVNYQAIDRSIKEIWRDYEFDYYEYFLDNRDIKKKPETDVYTAKIDNEIFESIDRRVESVLDLGCGTGRHIRVLRDLGSRKIFGIDKSKDNLLIAKKRGLGKAVQIDLNEVDINDIEGKFDLIVICAVFSYLNNSTVGKILDIINLKLNEGGFIVFTDFIFNNDRSDYKVDNSLAILDLKKEKLRVYHRNKDQIIELFKNFKVIKQIENSCLTFNKDHHPYIQILFKKN